MLFSLIFLLNLPGYFFQALAIEDIKIKDAPYTVTIEKKSHQFVSMGAILGAKWVITPASPVTPYAKNLNKLKVRSGSGKFLTGGGLHRIKNLFISPVDDPNGAVALVQIVNPFKFSLTVFSVPLAFELVNENETLSLIGWMHSSKKGSQLGRIEVEEVDFTDCADQYSNFSIVIPISMSCTSISSVQGHSGDLLVYRSALQGLFVDMNRKTAQGLPFTFIDVTYHGSWIKNTIHTQNTG